jgi:hypothetical protein
MVREFCLQRTTGRRELPAQDHASFRHPINRDAKIWRYMSHDKFSWILENKALYFRRADKFDDPSEGFFTRANQRAEDFFVSHQIRNGGFGAPEATSEESLREGYRLMLSVAIQDRANTFVNSWNMDENESDSMWGRYAPGHDSVSIQTSFSKLQQLLPNPCFLGGVNYIDFDTQIIDVTNSLNAIVHKEGKHVDDREIRAVVWGTAAAENFTAVGEYGIAVPIDLTALIERLHLHPSSTPGHHRSIEDLLRQHGLKV